MKKRGIAFMVVLTFITLGLYNLYWTISTSGEIRKKGEKIPSLILLFLPIAAIVAGWVIGAGGSIDSSGNVAVAIILLGIAATIGFWLYWLAKYCRAAAKVTNGDLSFGFNYFLGILMSLLYGPYFIWTIVVQNSFNKISPASAATPDAQPPGAPQVIGSPIPPPVQQPPVVTPPVS